MSLELSTLSPLYGSRRRKQRIGRGESSGRGKTSGRGGKGQTARTGGTISRHFEGGQMPLYRRVPKIGFISRKRVLGVNVFQTISLDMIDRFDAGTEVTPALLAERGLIRSDDERVKLLSSGTLTKPIKLKIHGVSANARAKVESLGGSVEILS